MGDMNSIIDTLPSMMNAIRMVWIISRHYNTDERMVPLMERIAHEVAGKVAEVIQVSFVGRLQFSSNLTTKSSYNSYVIIHHFFNPRTCCNTH